MTLRSKSLGLVSACAVLFGAAAQAQLVSLDDCNEPLDVGGDILEVEESIATLTGNVRVLQCDAVLSTAKLIGAQDEAGAYESLKAVGAVRFVSGADAIASETALYDRTTRTITFTDNVVVRQGAQIMTGGSLIYWIDSGRIRFTARTGGRIRGLIKTQSLDAEF